MPSESAAPISLSNGVTLHPGSRVRVPRKVVFDVPAETREALGLYLDDNAASYDSEVIVWPVPSA